MIDRGLHRAIDFTLIATSVAAIGGAIYYKWERKRLETELELVEKEIERVENTRNTLLNAAWAAVGFRRSNL